MRRARCRDHWIVLGALLVMAAPATAQVRLSERGAVSQTIVGTVITVDYARPQLRGRSPIFGGFVHWKEIWTPGANYATMLETNRKISLDGHDVAAGKYSVWFKVEPDQWTLVLDPHTHLYHTEPPDSAEGQMRWTVHSMTGPQTEILTFSFTTVRPTGATLQFNWGTTALALPIKVVSKHTLAIASADAAPYLGAWNFRWSVDGDSAAGLVKITYQDGMLFAHWDHNIGPNGDNTVLVKAGDDVFLVGTMEKGELTDLMTEMALNFSRTGGRATSFDARDETDKVMGSGKREEKR